MRAAFAVLVLLAGGAATAALPHIPLLDPNTPGLPAATIADNSDLLSAPAGARGFLFVGTDGRFYFEDGTRGRFWGINVAGESVFQPRAIIDAAVEAIARAGFNLVRLHHIDDDHGLLPFSRAGDDERIDPRRLDAVDYWIARLKERGIYVYLDLLDYRTFHVEEGVPAGPQLGRGAKPYAVFNERLMELQRDYARKLLFEHTNPYTGLAYAQDPAVAMVELCDENGLFRAEGRLGELVAPYREELLRRWNFRLLSQHGSREAIAEAWTDAAGRCFLGEDEDPRKGTVGLPGVTAGVDESAPRMADRSMFFAAVHREYFRAMVGFLRERGLRVPVSAVMQPRLVPELWAAAQELDYIATNYYYDHPYFRHGSEWQLPAFFSRKSALRDDTGAAFAPNVAAARVWGKPLVVREWNACWPNDSRGAALVEAAALACLQDVDAMILFTLDIRPQTRKLGYFDVLRDPTRWGPAAIGARMFLERQVAPARHTVAVGRTEAEVFHPDTGPLPTPVYQVARTARTGNVFWDDEGAAGGDVTVLAGRTATAYPGEQAVISSDSAATDAYGRGRASAAALSGYPAPVPASGDMTFSFGGTLFSPGTRRTFSAPNPFTIAGLAADPDLRAVGVSAHNTHCFGLRDMRRGNYVFGAIDDDLRLRATLDALGQLHHPLISHAHVDRKTFVADTEQVISDLGAGLLWVNAPLCHVVAGALSGSELLSAGPLSVESSADMGVCVWQSLDGLPADRSRRWMVKFVTVARNEGQQVRVHLERNDDSILALEGAGGEPILTLGRAAERGTRVVLHDRAVAQVFMRDGSFELHRAGERLFMYCDTPGVRWHLPDLGGALIATAWAPDGTRRELRLTQPFAWPEDTALLEVAWPEG